MRFWRSVKKSTFPIAPEKTHWASTIVEFLGMLIDSRRKIICIPLIKRVKALRLLENLLNSNKTTVLKLQQISGLLNFLCKGIFPGRAFVHRYYSKTIGKKQHHHVRVVGEMKADTVTWISFSHSQESVARPWVDFKLVNDAETIQFYSDASWVHNKGLGRFFNGSWCYAQWEEGFVEKYKPSIEYLELYALTVGVLLWFHKLKDRRVRIHCDNLTICHVLNSNSSSAGTACF